MTSTQTSLLNRASLALSGSGRPDAVVSEGLWEDVASQAPQNLANQAGPCSFPTVTKYQLPTPFYGQGQDGDSFGIVDGAHGWGNPAESGKVKVQLVAGPNVTWWKQMDVIDCGGNLITRDYTMNGKHKTVLFTFNTSEIYGASVVLWKAKFWGIHTPMYQMKHLERGDGQSWVVYWGDD